MIERALLTALLLACTHGGVAWWFHGVGVDSELATQAREDKARKGTEQIVATAIAGIKVNHDTTYVELEREVRSRQVFVDCRSGPDAMRLFNDAIAGQRRAGRGQLPASAPAR